MATKKKTTTKKVVEEPVLTEQVIAPVVEEKPKPKFPVGALVFIDKNVGADLNGFCLFPQYKKDAYTVEAYDPNNRVYTLRRQKLLVRLNEWNIVAPDANAHDIVTRMQF